MFVVYLRGDCVRAGQAYALSEGVSWVSSAARAFCSSSSIPVVVGCAPPSTRRAVRSKSLSVSTLSRRSSSVAPVSL